MAVDVKPCRHCDSTNTVKLGEALKTVVYFCFECGKSFTLLLTGKPTPTHEPT